MVARCETMARRAMMIAMESRDTHHPNDARQGSSLLVHFHPK
jgi:hypothetical protein